MAKDLVKEFGTFRSFLWPIHANERKKLIPMIIMLFCTCFNYSILRNMKDTVVIDACGPEVLSSIKLFILFPMAVVVTYVFAVLTNKFSQEKVFYIIISGFLSFYALFAFFIYPNDELFHLHSFADTIKPLLPEGLSAFVNMFRYWTFTLFYAAAELWSSIVISVLFWGFANEITNVGESRRFYAVMSIASNISAIIAGQAANYFSVTSTTASGLPLSGNDYEQTTMVLISVIILSGLVTMATFRWMNKNVLTDASFDDLHFTKKILKKKKKMSMKESFSFLSNSKYLICIAVLVISYNLVINLVEVIWKGQLKQLYPDKVYFQAYLNNLTTVVGIISTIVSFFMARMIGRLGWTWTAMITPIILFFTAMGFFVFFFFREHLGPLVHTFLGTSPLAIVVFFGAMQNTLSKASKYSVFDATKEIAFIPLDHEVKLKGKAAIDGVGSRFGKFGGSLIQFMLIMAFGNLASSAPVIAVFVAIAVSLWILAVWSLGLQFDALTGSNPQEEGSEEKESSVEITGKEQPATV